MAGKKAMNTKVEQRGSRVGRLAGATALYSAMILLGYVLCVTPEPGTAMIAVRDVLCGLGGKIAIVIPIMLGWIATLLAMKGFGKKVSNWKCVLDGVLWLCLFTMVHMFAAESVIRDRMTIHTFANFVSKSYAFGAGGGAIGALLAWPAYTYLGTFGGVLAALLLALLELTATGRLQRFVDWCLDRLEGAKHDAGQRRMEKKNHQMFDYDDFDAPESDAPKPVKKRRPDPDFDAPGHVKKRRAEPDFNPSMLDENRRSRTIDPDFGAPKPSKKRKPEPVLQTEGTVFYDPNTADDSPASRRRKSNSQLQRDVQSLLDAAELDAMEAAAGKPAKKPAKAQQDPFDDPDIFAEPEPPKPARAAKKPAKAAKTVEEGVRALSLDDDLTIEPEKCDVLENDDPPFDMPDKAKKPLKKLKRPAPKPEIEDEEEPYNYPPIDLLEMSEGVTENHREADMEKAQLLEDTLKQFGISTKLTGIAHGPAVTRFELQPAPGVKVSRISSLQDDIAMHLAAMSVRIEAPIPGKAAVGVEIPNEKVEMVRLRDVLESPEARKSASKIAVGLGKDNAGRYIVADIAKMPHVLIAGQTGSGKSVCINSIITSILFRATPDEVKLILIDPKMVELSIYNDIPHLVCPVVTDCKKAASALDWAVAEMAGRYKKFSERGVRDIKGFNKALMPGEKIMPQMVIIIDELADLMMVAPGEVEDSICRLAQLARAAGMHLVIATQRPSVNVITGIIKANIPTRIAFSVASQVDSRTMIDHGGAEKLLGNGDMLFVPSGINKPMRVQGAWVSDEEVHAITNYIKERSETSYDADMIEKMDNAARTDAEKEDFVAEYDPRLPEAVEIVVEAGQASVSMLQRRMRVGYARAGRLIDEMEQRGIVSEADGAKPRSVLITREEMQAMFEDDE